MGQFGLGEFDGREEGFDEAVELRRFRASLSRSWLLMIAVVVPLTALVLLVSLLLPPTYRASATIVLSEEGVGRAGDPGLVGRELETLERLVSTRPVLAAAARRLGTESVDTLSEQVSASASAEANLVRVTAEDGDAAGAARIANAVARTFLDQRAAAERRSLEVSRQTLQARIDRLVGTGRQGMIARLREALREIAVEEASGGPTFVLAEPARAPDRPDSPRILQNTLFALFGFVFIAVLIALARDQIAPRVQDARQLAHLMGAPLLLEMPVPQSKARRREVSERGPYELIGAATETLLPLEPGPLQTVLVTSPYRDRASARIASGLARTLASEDEKVVLLGAVEAPSRSGATPPTASELLRRVTTGEEIQDLVSLAETQPGVIAFSDDAGAALGSRTDLEALADRLAEHDVRFLVVLGRPLLVPGDGLLLASLVDGVVLVCRPQRTSRDAAIRLGRQLRSGNVNVLGIVSVGGSQVVPYHASRRSLESSSI